MALITDSFLTHPRKKLRTFAEAPFGHLKHNLGYRYFLLRGRDKAQAEFSLMCSAVNLKKMWAALNTPAPKTSLVSA